MKKKKVMLNRNSICARNKILTPTQKMNEKKRKKSIASSVNRRQKTGCVYHSTLKGKRLKKSMPADSLESSVRREYHESPFFNYLVEGEYGWCI